MAYKDGLPHLMLEFNKGMANVIEEYIATISAEIGCEIVFDYAAQTIKMPCDVDYEIIFGAGCDDLLYLTPQVGAANPRD
jgi:hypothetical protein